ncbi:2-hydroxyacid dehydrogenase [Rhizobium leguminosarum]|uniref:2-hydroxyacid dehydrogenase n=1 Tax=Rhizobium TaxID=379 RepID=UPI001C905A7D|nr:glyoxylate/hydroxypyruvate reductase A [Rhizobium leguminosarum]MBY2913952.1 glyoxylate/hydroxypyruvate reductase A [Rhizobium leguminosarum]MBY2940360.1 glyoxylate/hydroxypyruvate reductase A [Rhizobium leguminosarum]MBY2969489.1 glyoxylate/hydroxypyruvate reductase A [Rhizobium leguminosarum]MBY2976862.1 glyoxylate/hydroxypyruvate reductase A [Rhizobium leguminosarum]MBY3000041.1 glyoxylate/hydroxypyruvate reductase A [Rhizobium leguminosarum]
MPASPPVLVDIKFNHEGVARVLKTAFADRGSINLADPANQARDLRAVEYALLWKPDADLFARAPNLKVIFSGGAGVDHIIGMAGLPEIPIVRFVDRSLTTRMSEWVVMQCLMHLRGQYAHDSHQRQREWAKLIAPEAAEVTVGVMGLGILGQDAVAKLRVIGFNVIGWSRSRKQIDGVETFDASELDSFLASTDILVGLLPLTPETSGFYDAGLFTKLRRNGALGQPVFINAGRGKSQVEADIVSAIRNGILGGASLDVFEAEPLASDNPLWDLQNVFLTPHDAAVSEENALFRHVETQIARFERGEPLQFMVDRAAGY